jgi:SAM-dependent methyltransferase
MSALVDHNPKASFSCRLCGGSSLYLYYTLGAHDQFRYYRCPSCKLVNYDLGGGLDQSQYTELVDPLDDTAPRNLDKDATWRFIERYVPAPGSFLDIGCGPGRLLYLAKRAGWTVRGLELSAAMAEFARERLDAEILVADFLDYRPRPEDRFDLVSLRHVLEHLRDPLFAMRKINGLVKPGGRAILEFPNIDAADKRLKRLLIEWGLHRRKYGEDFVTGHCNEFCRTSFEHLLAKTGFELVRWETYSHKPVTNFIYNRIHIGNKARALIRKEAEVPEPTRSQPP